MIIDDYGQLIFSEKDICDLMMQDRNLRELHGMIVDHKFVIEIDNRDDVKKKLAERKIETKIHYERPLHELDGAFRKYPGPDMLAVASSLSRRVLSLPLYPELTDLEVEYIIDQVKDCVS